MYPDGADFLRLTDDVCSFGDVCLCFLDRVAMCEERARPVRGRRRCYELASDTEKASSQEAQ